MGLPMISCIDRWYPQCKVIILLDRHAVRPHARVLTPLMDIAVDLKALARDCLASLAESCRGQASRQALDW